MASSLHPFHVIARRPTLWRGRPVLPGQCQAIVSLESELDALPFQALLAEGDWFLVPMAEGEVAGVWDGGWQAASVVGTGKTGTALAAAPECRAGRASTGACQGATSVDGPPVGFDRLWAS